ncbi:MAG: serine/threonine-protein kinase [Planctomycetaceae bacterium]
MSSAHPSDAEASGATSASGSDSLESLQKLGKYEIRKKLGAGGMGIVFLAFDTELKRPVALKVLAKERAENPQLVRRFKSEAQAAAQLRHPNIVAIYEAGEADGYLFIALEYIEGHDVLTQIRKRGILPPKRSLHMIRQIADALNHAAEKNIVHRDIKPSNIMVQQDGTVKLADLGLARSIDDTLETDITRAGTTVGTVDYMSPEQARDSKAADIRSDIYSLGCSWYHMLAGVPPFAEGGLTNKLHAHASADRPDPRQLNDNVPDGYVAVMHRMMAKRPEDRYQTPAELLADIDKVGNTVAGVNTALLQALQEEAPVSSKLDVDEENEIGTKGSRRSSARDSASPPVDEEEHISQKMKVKPVQTPAPSSRSQRSRTTEVDPDDIEAAPESPLKGKLKRTAKEEQKLPPTTRKGKRAASSSSANASDDESSGSTSKKRTPPPRLGNAAQPAFQVDIDYVKFGLIAVAVAGLFGLGYWAFTASRADLGKGGGDITAAVQPREDGVVDGNNTVQENVPAVDATTNDPAYLLVPVEDIPVDRKGEPFPGTSDLPSPDGPESRSFVPDWVYAVRNGVKFNGKTITVDPQASSGSVTTLQEALRSSGDGESLQILLNGDGPFEMQPAIFVRRRHVRIAAAPGANPIIICRGTPLAGPENPHLELRGGLLELEGLHLLFSRTTEENVRRVAVGVDSGTLAIKHCTITVSGDTTAPTTACRAQGISPQRPARVLLYRSVIRGANVTALSAQSDAVDLVVAGSMLLTSGEAPLEVSLTPSASSSNSSTAANTGSTSPIVNGTANASTTPTTNGTSTAEPPTVSHAPIVAPRDSFIRLLGSTIVSADSVLRLRQSGDTAPATCHLQMRRSVQSSSQSTGNVCVRIVEWPNKAATESKSRVQGLDCSCDITPLVGWESLVRWERAVGNINVADAPGWESFWGQSLSTDAQYPQIPGLLPAPIDRTKPAVIAGHFDTITSALPYRGRIPGADLAFLPLPPDQSIDRQQTLANRPQLPPDFFPFAVSTTPFVVDLRKDGGKLTEILNGPNVPDGTHVQLVGSGLKKVAPFVVRNKKLRLQFVDDASAVAMIVQAEPVTGSPTPEAFLTVENGRVDLIGLNYRWAVDAPGIPQRFILLKDADLALSQSSIQGPPQLKKGRPPLIEWSASTPKGPRRFIGITSTMITGDLLVGGPMHNRLLSVNNSLLAARGEAILLKTAAVDGVDNPETDGWLQLNHCTIAASTSLFQIEGSSPSPIVRQTMHVSSVDCIYSPLPLATPQPTRLLTHPPNATPNKHISWWETRCGYSQGIQEFHGPPSNQPPKSKQQFVKDWQDYWGKEQFESPLLGTSAIMYSNLLTSMDNLHSRQFSLVTGSSAMSWGLGGSSLGANLNTIGVAPPTAPNPSTGRPNPNNNGKPVPRVNDL